VTDEEGIPTSAPDVVEGHEVREPDVVEQVVEPEPEAAPGPEPLPASEPAASRRGLVVLCALFGVLAFGFAVIAAVATQRLDERSGDRDDIAMTAHEFGEALLTYDYEHLEAAKQRVLALSTGNFRSEYEKAFNGGLDVLFRETKARSEGATEEVFVGEIDEESHTVTAIVVVNAVSQGAAGRRVLADSYIRLQLVKVGGEWRVDGVTNLNLAAPTSDLPVPTPGPTTTTTAAK